MDEEEEGQGSQEAESDRRGTSQPKSLKDRFREKVGEHCKDGAIVFVFVSGLQFPFEVSLLNGLVQICVLSQFQPLILLVISLKKFKL